MTLMIEALEEAAMFHDARSRVIDTAARRSARRFPGREADPGAGREADRVAVLGAEPPRPREHDVEDCGAEAFEAQAPRRGQLGARDQ